MLEVKIRTSHLLDILIKDWDEKQVISFDALSLLLRAIGSAQTERLIEQIPDEGLKQSVIDVAIRTTFYEIEK